MVKISEDPNALGNLVIRLGYASKADVLVALAAQERRLPLGETMVGRGFLTAEQLEHTLHVQLVSRATTLRKKTSLELCRQKKKAHELVISLKETTVAMRLFASNGNGKMVNDTGS